ncbi:hypothetical protein DOTSEDRAFT_68917 [Lecanosticta acicola]|uniref:FAD-binding domain-containing protein n=1 Tax=Lecanosticta acicola TaxID=111012 RepID=A0AAI8Z513_9PEZI|nr:hypothetical protein DOTSEDRAFT_68917 [Lecanosticta acicola]
MLISKTNMVFKIGIVGAGPAGTILARLLQQSSQDITVTIFESEGSINFRSQGGTLDLHQKTGLAAIKKANLYDAFLKHARYDGEAMKIADKKMLCYVHQGPSTEASGGRPEIDRPKLRELLYDSLPTGTVQWNKKLLSVERSWTNPSNLILAFADGTTQSGYHLIVGADGAWSKTRTLLTDAKPYYSGIGGHAFSIPDAKRKHPELYKLVNRGSVFAFSDGKSIMGQQMGDGSINVGTWAVRPTDWQTTCGYDVHDGPSVKAACAKEYADWDPRLVALTQTGDDDKIAPRDLFMLPIGQSWEHVPGVTLIGDAAHVMTPFAGEGVNLAFQDALKLSEAIISAATSSDTSSLDAKIQEFERDMFQRMTETQQLTYDMMNAMYYTPGAPRSTIEKYVVRAVEGEMGPWVTSLLLKPIVYAWFFVFKLIW